MTIECEARRADSRARFLTDFAAPGDIYFSAVTINLLTYFYPPCPLAYRHMLHATCVSHYITATEVCTANELAVKHVKMRKKPNRRSKWTIKLFDK